jgi:hypothetical protein
MCDARLVCIVMLLATLAAGCRPLAGVQPGEGAGGLTRLPADEGATVTALLAQYQRQGGLAAEEARRELAAAQQAYAKSRDEAHRLRLLMALLVPGATRDDVRALGLLDAALAERPRAGPLRHLLLLLQSQVAERARGLREEQKRGADLQQKLDALNAIERSLGEREPQGNRR